MRVDRPVEQAGNNETAVVQASDKGRGPPTSVWYRRDHPRPAPTARIAAGHVGRRPSLVDEDQLRGQDLNLRPSGYEPDELPGCSTPRGGAHGLEDLAATYSPATCVAVPWALGGFTAEFGMGSGADPPPKPPGRPAHTSVFSCQCPEGFRAAGVRAGRFWCGLCLLCACLEMISVHGASAVPPVPSGTDN